MGDPRIARTLRGINAGMAAAALTALASLIAEHGLLAAPRVQIWLRILDLGCVLAFAALQTAKLVVVEHPLRYLRGHKLDFSFLFVIAIQTLVHLGLRETPEFHYLDAYGSPSILWAFYIAVLQLYLVSIVVVRSPLVHRLLARLRLRPVQMLVVSFLLLIAAGTSLLALPGAARGGQQLGLVDALFTATSAVCVTGLVVVDTGSRFSALGHGLLLALIQAGGIGVLTITGSFAVFGGSGLGSHEREALAGALEVAGEAELRLLLRRILIVTFTAEMTGAMALHVLWADALPDVFQRATWAVFHSVSAFCNAGFALFPEGASLTRFAAEPGTVLVVSGLIVAGGLGVGVLTELSGWLRSRSSRRRPPSLTRHARWVLGSSASLIAAGAAVLAWTEAGRSFAGLDGPGRFWAALFQSVTLRTAGFNTVDVAAFGPPAVVLAIAWMLVGGSPGGSAGGMKTTTALASISAILRRPRLDRGTRRRALRLAGLFLGAYAASCAILVLAQGHLDRRVAFEAASALGTVGLSMNYTAELTTTGKLAVCLMMFAGRVGPFALAASILRLDRDEDERPPSGRILLG